MNLDKIIRFSVGPIGAALLSLIALPLITWFFVAEDVGRISMLHVSISFCVLLFGLGLDQSYVREYHESDNKKQLFKTSVLPGLFLLIVSLFVVVVLPFSVTKFLFGIESQSFELIVIVCFLSAYISRFLSLILRMQERGLAFSMSQLLPKVVLLLILVTYTFFISEFQFIHLLMAHMISIASITLVLSWNARGEWVSALFEKIDYDKLNLMLHFGMPLILGGLAFWALTVMDKLFIRNMSTFTELALYSVAVSFAAVAIIFQTIFTTLWAPTVYKWTAEGANSEKIDKVTEYVLIAVVVIFSSAGLFSWLVTYLLPEEYAEVQYILVACMAYPLFYTLSEATVVGLGISKKSGYSMLASLIAFFVNAIGNYLLVPYFGAKGAAISTAISFWLFLVLRTEFSSRIWRPLPRARLYIGTFICLLNSIGFCLLGDKYPYYFFFSWLAIFVTVTILYRREMSNIYIYVKNKENFKVYSV